MITFDDGWTNSPASSSRGSLHFGKGGLQASGRDSLLSQSSTLSASARDSFTGSISLEKRPSRTRAEMLDAIKANRQGSGTNLNVISIVNTSSFNITPSSMGSANRSSQYMDGNNDVITAPRRISKVMGFNKLEFNPMALDQDRVGPLLELGKEEKKGKDDRTTSSFISTTNNHNSNNDNSLRVISQPLTSNASAGESTIGSAAPGQKHGTTPPMPHIHTIAHIEVCCGSVVVDNRRIMSYS